MADSDRTPPRSVTLVQQLAQEPYTFDFFQAVRRMDCQHPDKPRTGDSVRLADDPIRFGQEPSLAFAPATLESLDLQQPKTPRLIQRFFGLFGPQGPLPLHITEYVRERIRNHGDHTLRRFCDLFHHRMTALFYRAWASVRPTVSFDQPSSDRFGDYVGSLFGLGMSSLEGRDAFPDLPKRHFAGLMGCQTHHAEGLLAILSGYFRLPVQLQEFIGQWIELPSNCRCLLGESSAGLGVNTTVGSHVWDCQQKFRVIFGPLQLEDYYRMLPGGTSKSSSVEHGLGSTQAAAQASEKSSSAERGLGATRAAAQASGKSSSVELGLGATRAAAGAPNKSFDFELGPGAIRASSQASDNSSGVEPGLGKAQATVQASENSSGVKPGLGEAQATTQAYDKASGVEFGLGATRAAAQASDKSSGAQLGLGEAQAAARASDKSSGIGLGLGATRAPAQPSDGSPSSMLELWGQAARSSGVSLDRLMAAVRSYTGDELQWDLQLILKKQETPPLGLGIVGRLGWSSWMIRDPMSRDPDDLVLDTMRVPDDVEPVQFARVRDWNSRILGQTRDGQYIVATIDSDGSGLADLNGDICAVTTVDPAVNFSMT